MTDTNVMAWLVDDMGNRQAVERLSFDEAVHWVGKDSYITTAIGRKTDGSRVTIVCNEASLILGHRITSDVRFEADGMYVRGRHVELHASFSLSTWDVEALVKEWREQRLEEPAGWGEDPCPNRDIVGYSDAKDDDARCRLLEQQIDDDRDTMDRYAEFKQDKDW